MITIHEISANRAIASTAIVLLATTLSACAVPPAQTQEEHFVAAKRLHSQMISIDTHVDIPQDFATPAMDPGKDSESEIDLPKMDEGGLTGAVFAVFVSQQERTAENYRKAHEAGRVKLDAIHRMAEQYPGRIEIARHPEDVKAINARGKRVAIIGMLNGFPLGPHAEHLDYYYERGLRQVGFTHAGNNDLADSSRPQTRIGDTGPEHGGLSATGKQLVQRLNQRGIVVDVSQLTPEALRDAVSASATPVVASHSGIMSIVPHPRNLSDESLELIAKSGGVVSIVAFSAYLVPSPFDFRTEAAKIQAKYNVTRGNVDDLDAERRSAYEAELAELVGRLPRVAISDYIDSIDYAVNLIGIDHVGISSDFNHGGGLADWPDASASYRVTAALLARGYDESAIAKLWGGNWLRVFEAATEYASVED